MGRPARLPIVVLLGVCLAFAASAGAQAPMAAADEGAEVSRLIDAYLERWFEMYPSGATAAGRHDRDRQLEDVSDDRVDDWVGFNREVATALAGFLRDRDGASHDDPVSLNAELVLRQARREIYGYQPTADRRADPLFWSGTLSGATVFLLVRDDLPADERVRSATARAGQLPRLAAQAVAALEGLPAEATSPDIARIARSQVAASADFYGAGFAETVRGLLAAQSEDGEGPPPGLVAAAEAAGAGASAALGRLVTTLDALAERATGAPQMGAERYAETYRLVTGDLRPVPEIAAAARFALDAQRTEAAEYGRSVWVEVMPAGTEPPADDAELLRRLFDRVAEDRAASVEAFVGQYQDLLDRSVAFVKERDVITVPEPLTVEINRSPSYFVGQSVGGVYPAGPYAPDADTLFYLPTPPDGATPEQRDAFFRDFNDHFNIMIMPHEMVPGHYLQLKRSAFEAPVVRSLFGDGVYIEGWGTFCERLMLDLGWGGPLDRLAHLKKQMENIARTVVDIEVHTQGMGRDEVIAFVRDEALQDDQFAANMWVRALTSSPQLTSYFQGYEAVMGLYRDVREARGEEFDLKEFMDGMMELGPVAVERYRERMLGRLESP
jgi:uncharacterized protein (DUF885 family)